MFGCYLNDFLGKVHFYLFFLAANLTFFPMHFMGLAGMPRRITDYPDAFFALNAMASLGAILGVLSFFIFLFCIFKSLQEIDLRPYKDMGLLPKVCFLSLSSYRRNTESFHNVYTFPDSGGVYSDNIFECHQDALSLFIFILLLLGIILFYILLGFKIKKLTKGLLMRIREHAYFIFILTQSIRKMYKNFLQFFFFFFDFTWVFRGYMFILNFFFKKFGGFIIYTPQSFYILNYFFIEFFFFFIFLF